MRYSQAQFNPIQFQNHYKMEEYRPVGRTQHTCSQGSIAKASEHSQTTMRSSLHRQVSLVYGLEFQSKVPLFAKMHQSTAKSHQSAALAHFQHISKEDLYRRVLSFLQMALGDSATFLPFLETFQNMDNQMQLSIKKSVQSISSRSSQLSSNSDSGSGKKVKQAGRKNEVLVDMSNSCEPPTAAQEPVLRKTRTSMMRKSNHISIAQTINIGQLHKLAKIEAIQSAQSLQSSKSSIQDFKSKRRLSSQNSQSQSDTRSIPDLPAIDRTERRNKVSIILLDDFSQTSELFSQQDTYLSLSHIQLPQLALNKAMLDVFFDPPAPYLVNLALCLLCKCISKSQIALSLNSAGWMLGVSTIVAYKVYYDQAIEGLIEWFCEGMKMELLELVKLQRWFLASLNYEAAVSSQQYHIMLMRLMNY